jgi:periplasmic divalent cation tolerance protein
MKPVLVLTTVGPDFDAKGLAHALVEERVAACVNIVAGVHSVYRWENAVVDDAEQLLLIKTTDERVDALREALFARHPYQVPEFVVVAVDGISEAYGGWVVGAVR